MPHSHSETQGDGSLTFFSMEFAMLPWKPTSIWKMEKEKEWGPYGARLRNNDITSLELHWLEFSHMVTVNYKGGWDNSLAI